MWKVQNKAVNIVPVRQRHCIDVRDPGSSLQVFLHIFFKKPQNWEVTFNSWNQNINSPIFLVPCCQKWKCVCVEPKDLMRSQHLKGRQTENVTNPHILCSSRELPGWICSISQSLNGYIQIFKSYLALNHWPEHVLQQNYEHSQQGCSHPTSLAEGARAQSLDSTSLILTFILKGNWCQKC